MKKPWTRSDLIALLALIISLAFPLTLKWWDARYVTQIEIARDMIIDVQRRGGEFDRVVFKIGCRNAGSVSRQVTRIELQLRGYDSKNLVLVFPVDQNGGATLPPSTSRIFTGGISFPEHEALAKRQWDAVNFVIQFGDGGKEIVDAREVVFGRGNLIIPKITKIDEFLK